MWKSTLIIKFDHYISVQLEFCVFARQYRNNFFSVFVTLIIVPLNVVNLKCLVVILTFYLSECNLYCWKQCFVFLSFFKSLRECVWVCACHVRFLILARSEAFDHARISRMNTLNTVKCLRRLQNPSNISGVETF